MTGGKIKIRTAKDGDIPALIDFLIKLDAHVAGVAPEVLALTATGQAQLQERVQSFLDEPGKRLVVAVGADNTPVAMGNIHIWEPSDAWLNPERQGLRAAFIDDIWVEPDHRASGIARRIVAALIDFAEREGVNEVSLDYALHNPEAEAFWSRLGFRPTGVRASAPVTGVRERLERSGEGRKRRK